MSSPSRPLEKAIGEWAPADVADSAAFLSHHAPLLRLPSRSADLDRASRMAVYVFCNLAREVVKVSDERGFKDILSAWRTNPPRGMQHLADKGAMRFAAEFQLPSFCTQSGRHSTQLFLTIFEEVVSAYGRALGAEEASSCQNTSSGGTTPSRFRNSCSASASTVNMHGASCRKH